MRTPFGGMEVFTCGPWCQGPVLLQMLSLLEGVDLKALGHNTPAYVHLVTEAMKLCFADRDRYYGDPRVVEVPMDALLAPAYAEERRRLIGERAFPEMPPAGRIPGFGGAVTRAASRQLPAVAISAVAIRRTSASSIVTATRSRRRPATRRGTAR